MLVKNKVAIVTGGSKGIGKEIALTLSKEGAKVSIWSRSREPLNQTTQEIEAAGAEALPLQVDVSDSSQVNQAVQQVIDTWGRIDILVNNAAALPSSAISGADPEKMNPFLDMTDQRWAEEINTNLSGVFYCIRAVTRQMMEQRSGRIISIGSLAGINGGFFSTPSYSASKAGLMGMTMLAARWLGKYGINVNVVNPGPVLTEGAAFGEAQIEALKKTIPFRRGGDESDVLGTTKDIANAVLYFASDLGAYVTGTKMNVFGGQAMG